MEKEKINNSKGLEWIRMGENEIDWQNGGHWVVLVRLYLHRHYYNNQLVWNWYGIELWNSVFASFFSSHVLPGNYPPADK